MFRRHHVLVSLSTALVMSVILAGCSEDEQAKPRVTLAVDIIAGGHPRSECTEVGGPWFNIGRFANPAAGRVDEKNPESPLKEPSVPVDDGAADQQGTVSLSCAVKERGDGFDVAANASLSGATGGAFTVVGFFKRDGSQPNISLTVVRRGTAYAQSDCVATYDVTAGQGVAPGRVWATVECPNATNTQGTETRICTSKAQFRLENCGQ